jgi:hypothetical protein
LYSPQIDPQLVRIIYKKAKEAKKPMTKYVNGLLREKLIEKVEDKPIASESTLPQINSKVA